MKVIHRNTELPIELLKPHPDNPRRDVGDVTELADSIRVNGIFQNLTVLKGDAVDGYTVLIGHRRLAAAKQAGLELVPCMVVEMDEREQISTMLLENMQRSDLTVYEQAQGFQMMLDLGETQDGIAEKTGFSKTTIRHRLKLLELDPEEFRKSQERQPTLADYIELEKISDPELRNKALTKIGTSDFKWTVDSAVSEERRRESRAQWLEYLPTVAIKMDTSKKSEYRFLQFFYMGGKPTDSDKRKASEFLEKNELYYSIESNNYVYIYCKRPTEADEPSEAETTAAEQRRKRA
ncbi:MAG: ParB/RepB/Spo0J family partition protein [Ruminococcus sp.]|nr:ParB/RepB/Spo0J family partition protein [Ruminococcus sp.]